MIKKKKRNQKYFQMVVNNSLIYDFLDCDDLVKTLFILFHDAYFFIGFSYYVIPN